jgi:hypothetical protein
MVNALRWLTDDPRCKPGAYIHDGSHLYLVKSVEPDPTLGVESSRVLVEDACDFTGRVLQAALIISGFKLAQPAPECPDTREAAA